MADSRHRRPIGVCARLFWQGGNQEHGSIVDICGLPAGHEQNEHVGRWQGVRWLQQGQDRTLTGWETTEARRMGLEQ